MNKNEKTVSITIEDKDCEQLMIISNGEKRLAFVSDTFDTLGINQGQTISIHVPESFFSVMARWGLDNE